MNLQSILRVRYLDHDKDLSDHVGIKVEITNEHGFQTQYVQRKLVNQS